MNQRPLTADELETLSEYLWQFTMFNNSDYAVESSTRSASGSTLTQTIRMGQLVRGVAGACDTVQLVDWTHTMNSADGSLTRSLTQRAHVPGEERFVGCAELRGLIPPREASELLRQLLQVRLERGRELRMRQRVFHVGLQIAELAAAVEALAREPVRIHGFVVHETRDAVGELDFTARAFTDAFEVRENARREQVATYHREI